MENTTLAWHVILFIANCCTKLNITATGGAKSKQSERLGNFVKTKDFVNGKALYKQASRVNDPNYLYYDVEHEEWGVWNY